MNCKHDNATYGGQLFCKVCGMDIGIEHTKQKKNGKTHIYCCDTCASNGNVKF